MSHWWFCCPRQCRESSDQFGRTEIGSDWEICSGDWEIANPETNGILVANTQGVIVWKVQCSDPRYAVCRVHICDPTEGAHYRICAFYKEDCSRSSPWLAADLEITKPLGVLVGTLNLLGCDASPEVDAVVGDRIVLELCVGATAATAMMTPGLYAARCCDPGDFGHDGYCYFALANVSETEPAKFDNAYQIDHYDYDPNPLCPVCGCSCEGHCLPLSLTLTLANVRGCMALDGREFELHLGTSPCQWKSDLWDCGEYHDLYWELVPTGADLSNYAHDEFTLVLQDLFGNVHERVSADASSVCDPLWIVFKNMRFTSSSPYYKCCEGYEDPECPDWDPNPEVEYRWCPGLFDGFVTA